MPKVSVEIPGELLEDLDEHVGSDGKFVNRSDAIRASIRKTLDILDGIDARHGRIDAPSGRFATGATDPGTATGTSDAESATGTTDAERASDATDADETTDVEEGTDGDA